MDGQVLLTRFSRSTALASFLDEVLELFGGYRLAENAVDAGSKVADLVRFECVAGAACEKDEPKVRNEQVEALSHTYDQIVAAS